MPRGLQRTLDRAATRAFPLATPVAGLSRRVSGHSGQYQLVFTLAAMPLIVTDALAYASQKLITLPQGRVYFKGGAASLAFAVTTARASTINDSAAMDWALGTVAASSITLATTMLDIVAKQDKNLDGAVAAYTTASNANAAAPAFFDGTTTAVDVFLNVSFPTITDIDADGTLNINGSITLNFEMQGDY